MPRLPHHKGWVKRTDYMILKADHEKLVEACQALIWSRTPDELDQAAEHIKKLLAKQERLT